MVNNQEARSSLPTDEKDGLKKPSVRRATTCLIPVRHTRKSLAAKSSFVNGDADGKSSNGM